MEVRFAPVRLLALCCIVALVTLVPASALAKPSKSATLMKEAEELYGKGEYREAAEKLKAANELEPHPKLIYNIARAYDQAGDNQLALDYYRQYVSSPADTDPALMKKANLAMDRLRALLAKEEAVRAAQDAERKKLEGEKAAA